MGSELTLQELQAVCLDILKDVHDFCTSNGIRYSVSDGSMIGVVRHRGFIPWDDDVDLIMPRPDYERFCASYRSDRFRLICPQNDADCRMAFARVYDDCRTVVQTALPWCDRPMGVWIDIFVADGAPDDPEAALARYESCRAKWAAVTKARKGLRKWDKTRSLEWNVKALVYRVLYRGGAAIPGMLREWDAEARSIPFGSTGFWSQYVCPADNCKEHNSMASFSSCHLMPFETIEVSVLDGYDECLTNKYGNYMELPPEEKRHPVNTHNRFYWK